jgi:F420-dependent oxidoreductase-like protein
MSVRISLAVTDFSWPGPPTEIAARLGEVARAADEGGLDTLWVADHLLQADPNSRPEAEMLEAYATLGFLAARTERIRLGAMVSPITVRPPALLIKAVCTLDVLSGGRAWLGLGAGYEHDEARFMGLSRPPLPERFERLEETLRLAARMFSGDESMFEGRHYRLERPISSPAPLSRPRPPILVGGMGERRTLRLVARYADACNLFDIPDEGRTIRRKLEVLARHCEEVGRDPGAIQRTLSTRLEPGETPERFAERCLNLAALGIDHAVVVTAGAWGAAGLDVLCAAARLLGGRNEKQRAVGRPAR